jgi:hypothetical protein
MDKPDEKYHDSKLDAVVAMTLFGGLSEEAIDKALSVDLSVYLQALLFQRCMPHGLSLKKTVRCINDECYKALTVTLPITGNILDVDISDLLANYIYLTKELSIEGFFSLTMPEYNAFIQAMNTKLRAAKR